MLILLPSEPPRKTCSAFCFALEYGIPVFFQGFPPSHGSQCFKLGNQALEGLFRFCSSALGQGSFGLSQFEFSVVCVLNILKYLCYLFWCFWCDATAAPGAGASCLAEVLRINDWTLSRIDLGGV